MANMTAFVGEILEGMGEPKVVKGELYGSIGRLPDWLERNDYSSCDPFEPKYYDHSSLPPDIQCYSQPIDTLAFFSDRDPESLPLAIIVARWTMRNVQDKSGYFYYRRYSRWLVDKTPTLLFGKATMLCAVSRLHNQLSNDARFV
jgi:hypothetical protein